MTTRAWLVASLLLFAGTGLTAPVPKEAKPAPNFPGLTAGTRWEYVRNGDDAKICTEEVLDVSEKNGVQTIRVKVHFPPAEEKIEHFELRDGDLYLTGVDDQKYDKPMLVCKASLKEGDKWESTFALNGTEYTVACTVGKAEQLKTPAGTFTALPISRTYVNLRTNSELVFWYADGVGLVRQTTNGTSAQELKAFTAGAKKK